MDLQPQRAGKCRGDRPYSDRVPRNHTRVEPPATIRLCHRVSNVNKKSAGNKEALRGSAMPGGWYQAVRGVFRRVLTVLYNVAK